MEAPLIKRLNYQDAMSSVALWWKSVLLMPVWGLAVIPLIGAFALIFINDRSLDPLKSPGWQVCLAITMVACIVHFIHDILKRTICITSDQIKFGLRSFPLDMLISVGVEYKSEQMMPRQIILRFRDGRILKLKVSRLRYHEFESLLNFVETRLPQVQIDPVTLTLMRCRRAAGKAISDSGESVEIRYDSRVVLKELIDVFMKSWGEWQVYGPIVAAIVFIPCWSYVITQLFMTPVAVMSIYESADKVALLKLLVAAYTNIYGVFEALIKSNYDHAATMAGNPLVIVPMITLAAGLSFFLVKMVLRPNRIIVQADCIKLIFRLGSQIVYSRDIPIETITKISLYKPDELADPSTWLLRISLSNDKHYDLSIGALHSEEKTRFTRAIQRLAPQIPIDSELLETLIPKQERSYTELWLQSLSAAPERRSMDPLQPGQMLSNLRYQLIRCLGVGGQGTAYLCNDTALVQSHLSDLVVLKESIFPVYADSSVRMMALERFEKEASLLRRLEHPGIVALRDYFLEDHRGYLVMEHVEGKTLKQIVEEQGALSEMRVRELALQMCDTLVYLHANGVVHRDFTPDNLILSKGGQLKLIDFNVAQQMEAGSAGTIVGKQSYIPPEQFRGKATTQSDIYAMGATLHFLLTGEEPEPISQSSPLQKSAACSASIDQIVKDCTALQLQKRIATAELLKDRLNARLEPKDEAASPPETIKLKQQEEVLNVEKR